MTAVDDRVFDHIVIIMFENEYRNYVRQNSYMRSLAASGIDMATFFGVMHPSHTNYIASVAGETCGITADPFYSTLLATPENPYFPMPAAPAVTTFTQPTVVDRIHQKGLQWRAYMEAYRPIEFPPKLTPVMQSDADGTTTIDQVATSKQTILDYPPYINAHNPFVRFQSILGQREQWERIGTIYDFYRDCLNGTLPEYSWITPGVWGDGHWMWGSYDEPPHRAPHLVDQLASWLKTFFSVLSFPGPGSRMPPKTLVVVTFDESEYNLNYETVNEYGSDYDGPNQIYTVLLGDTIAPRRIDHEGFNHYSLLKTIEKNFGLDPLGKNDTDANWFRFLWDEQFRWSAAEVTPIEPARCIAAAGVGETLWVFSGDGESVLARSWHERWSDATRLPAPEGTDALAAASWGDLLVVICRSGGALSMLQSNADGGWSESHLIGGSGVASFAITSFNDYGDGSEKLMLVFAAASDGSMQAQTFADGAWSSATPVGQSTTGAIALTALGTSLFLIYQAAEDEEMNVVSYNTAPFNVISGAGNDDTTQYAWSLSAFPVANFAFRRSVKEGDAVDPLLRPYRGIAPLAAAALDGVIHLAHPAASSPQVVTETFSIGGLFTAAAAISDITGSTGSNGWGTLAEAGWSQQQPIAGVRNLPAGAMAMARFETSVALLTQESAGDAIALTLGRYERPA